MLISKANRKAIFTKLFKEGVMIAEKDFNAPAHPEFPEIPNLQIIKACQSLDSRGFVKTQFAWRHFYFYLTDEGIEYLREYLHLPVEVVPDTHKRQVREGGAAPRAGGRAPRPAGGFRQEGGDDYRRGGDKMAGSAPGSFEPQFRGSYGRGAPQ